MWRRPIACVLEQRLSYLGSILLSFICFDSQAKQKSQDQLCALYTFNDFLKLTPPFLPQAFERKRPVHEQQNERKRRFFLLVNF
jgi:hypothetical protein